MDDGKTYTIPLALCKQASMKLDAFMADIHEIMEDEDLGQEHKQTFATMLELANTIMVNLVNTIREECDEEDFISEKVPMDEIDPWPGEGGEGNEEDLLMSDSE